MSDEPKVMETCLCRKCHSLTILNRMATEAVPATVIGADFSGAEKEGRVEITLSIPYIYLRSIRMGQRTYLITELPNE